MNELLTKSILSYIIKHAVTKEDMQKCYMLSSVRVFTAPWALNCQLSMEFSRQEYWSGWPFPSRGDLPDPEIEPRSVALKADSLLSEPNDL